MKGQKCPHCGGPLVFSITDETVSCKYCGAIIETPDISIEQRRIYVDAARIRESDNKTRLREKELDMESQRDIWEREGKIVEQIRQHTVRRTRIALSVILIAIVISLGVSLLLVNHFRHVGDVKMPSSSSSYIGESLDSVKQQLTDLGFQRIQLDERADLSMSRQHEIKKVTEISIDGNNSFQKGIWVRRNAKVILTYHVIDPARASDIKVPASSYTFYGKNYDVVQKQFLDAGFTNVEIDPIVDVTLFTQDYASGDVFQVTINGASDFSEFDYYPKDVSISISLHADSKLAAKIILDEGSSIEMPKKASKYTGALFWDVKKQVESLGFTDIKLEAMNDLTKKESNNDGKVSEVLINGSSSFKKGDIFSCDAEVTIRYHSISEENLAKYQIGRTSSSFEKERLQTALDFFNNLSFTNVVSTPLYDLDSSSDKNNGLIDSVKINGSEIKKKEYYSLDAEIVIYYHSVSQESLDNETDDKIVMPKASSKYLGKDYQKVESELRELGFSDISLVPIQDIKSFEIWRNGNVCDITIDSSKGFVESARFSPAAKITITYHSR